MKIGMLGFVVFAVAMVVIVILGIIAMAFLDNFNFPRGLFEFVWIIAMFAAIGGLLLGLMNDPFKAYRGRKDE